MGREAAPRNVPRICPLGALTKKSEARFHGPRTRPADEWLLGASTATGWQQTRRAGAPHHAARAWVSVSLLRFRWAATLTRWVTNTLGQNGKASHLVVSWRASRSSLAVVSATGWRRRSEWTGSSGMSLALFSGTWRHANCFGGSSCAKAC